MHTATELLTQTGAVTPGGLLSHLLPPGPSFVDLKLIHWSIQVSLWSVFISGYGHTFTSGSSSTWANLHFISACLHSSVETHMHVEKKWLPTERGSTPPPPLTVQTLKRSLTEHVLLVAPCRAPARPSPTAWLDLWLRQSLPNLCRLAWS